MTAVDASRQVRAPRAAAHSPWRAACRWAGVLALLIGLIAVPHLAGFAVQRLLVEVFTVLTIALAWNLLAGFGGMVVVGLHAFVGTGAYALFAISNGLGLNPLLALPLALAVVLVVAASIALPLFRLSGAYFAVATWVVAEMMRIGALNSEWLGAGAGMPLTTLQAFGRAERNAAVYWAALGVAVAALLAARTLLRSRMGLALAAVRDSEPAAQASGVPVRRVKLVLWLLAAAMAGLAGAVAYMNTLQVSPDASFGLSWTAAAIFISVLGGIGRLEGPVVGTLVYFALRESLAGLGAWYFIVLGVLAVVVMLAAPGGAWSLVQRHWPRFDPLRMRRTAPAPTDPAGP